jgi:FSR family fosmidomycin resistance protein-like MFS transporter
MEATTLGRPLTHVEEGADSRGIRLLTIAHAINDANQSALPAIIPWLISHRGLSLATAATLVLAMNLSSSVVQPLFGYLSDKRSFAWSIPIAIMLASFGTACIGLAPTLPLMLVGALIAGIGSAAFHPEASRFANYFAGAKRAATGMSWFTLGGYLGFALGPIIVTPLILTFGLHGTAFMMLPAAIASFYLWRNLPNFEAARARAHRARRERVGEDNWKGFSILSLVVVLRSTTFFAAVTFTPIFALRVTHVDHVLASVALAILLIAGAAGTVWGGKIADRIDRRRVVSLSLALTALSAIAIALCGTYAPSYALYVPLAIAFGFSLGISASVIVVIGQEYLPKRIGVASGLTLGLAVTIGGLAAPFFGTIGDRFGMVAIFAVVTIFAAMSLIGSFFMPRVHALHTTPV